MEKVNLFSKKICFLLLLNFIFCISCESQGFVENGSQSSIDRFMGESVFSMQKLFDGRGGPKTVITQDGAVLAFHGKQFKKSKDGGNTWSEAIEIGPDAGGNVLINEANGEILYIHYNGYLWKSNDNGENWLREYIEILPDGFGFGSPEGVPLNIGADQAGTTLMFGEHKGRLITTARILGPKNSNDVMWRSYHYNTAIYSDDGGKTWETSKPFPVLGTGEAALAEMSDGSIIYCSREHMSKGNRYFATSYDGGITWLDPYRSDILPDGPRGTSYGCMGGFIRLPLSGYDILIYSNLDTDAGTMPEQVGGSTGSGRERMTVWASFDGGRTWPVKRLVFQGPSAYSSLGVGRSGTPTEGKIYLMFEGDDAGSKLAVNVAVFNLSWILNDSNIKKYLRN